MPLKQDSLENHFLIAMPQLQDSFFANSLVYLWRHSHEGALGIVVNQPLEIKISDIFEQLGLQDFRQLDAPQTVLAGGPVETDKGFVLHDAPGKWSSSIEISEGITITTSRDILQDIAQAEGPDHYLIALGCAGWSPGQLEQEIINNVWLTCPARKQVLFSRDHSQMTNMAVSALGFRMDQLSPDASHC
jgi:putative transcriptional regulator